MYDLSDIEQTKGLNKMQDIIFPKNNEQEFIQTAKALKTRELCFIYSYEKNNKEKKEILKELQKQTKIKLNFGILAQKKDIQKAKQISNFVITPESDQSIFEKSRPNLIFNLELLPQKDKMHYRNSGLNQVLCNLAKENNIQIGFSFSTILNSKNRVQLLGRIAQNLKLCKKYKLQTIIASFAQNPSEMRNLDDLKALQSLLGKDL